MSPTGLFFAFFLKKILNLAKFFKIKCSYIRQASDKPLIGMQKNENIKLKENKMSLIETILNQILNNPTDLSFLLEYSDTELENILLALQYEVSSLGKHAPDAYIDAMDMIDSIVGVEL